MQKKLVKTKTGKALRTVKSPAKRGTIAVSRIRAAVKAVLREMNEQELKKIKIA